MSAEWVRRSLTAAMVQVRLTNLPQGVFDRLNESRGLQGSEEVSRTTIARAQSISTNDAMPYARVKQIGFPTVVEDVPLFMESTGNMSAIVSVDTPTLYQLGIYDFVNYLLSCKRQAIDISIVTPCLHGSTDFANPQEELDRLTNVKFTAVARTIDVGGQLVTDSASFYFIRTLNPETYLPST